jgi:trk system potassium uptake protein TrkA
MLRKLSTLHPANLLLFSYLATIAVGTGILMLPIATVSGRISPAEALKGLGGAEMDSVVVSTGGDISNSILICYHLHELGVKTVIAKVEDETHAEILKKLGASDTIRPAKDTAARLARRLARPNILEFLPLEEDYSLVQVDPPKSFIGRTLKEINLRSRYDVYVIAVKELVPERLVIVPPTEFLIKDSDILIMIGKTKNMEKIKELK